MNNATVVTIQPIRFEHMFPQVQEIAVSRGKQNSRWLVAHSQHGGFWTFAPEEEKENLTLEAQAIMFNLDEEDSCPFFILWNDTEYLPEWINPI